MRQLSRKQTFNACPCLDTVIMRIAKLRSSNGNHLFGTIETCCNQFTQHGHVLRVHRPNNLTFINRVDMGDLRTDVSCGVWTLYEMS